MRWMVDGDGERVAFYKGLDFIYVLIHGPFYILLSGQHQNWRWHDVLGPFTGDLLPRLDKNILYILSSLDLIFF